MRAATKVALVCASAAVAVAACGGNTSTSSPPASTREAAAVEMVTLTLGATGDAGTEVTYTCMEADVVDECVDRVPAPDVWSTQVTVPVGTTVRVQARGRVIRSLCTIADESDTERLDYSNVGECEAVAK